MGTDERQDLGRRRQKRHRINCPEEPQNRKPRKPVGLSSLRFGLLGLRHTMLAPELTIPRLVIEPGFGKAPLRHKGCTVKEFGRDGDAAHHTACRGQCAEGRQEWLRDRIYGSEH